MARILSGAVNAENDTDESTPSSPACTIASSSVSRASIPQTPSRIDYSGDGFDFMKQWVEGGIGQENLMGRILSSCPYISNGVLQVAGGTPSTIGAVLGNFISLIQQVVAPAFVNGDLTLVTRIGPAASVTYADHSGMGKSPAVAAIWFSIAKVLDILRSAVSNNKAETANLHHRLLMKVHNGGTIAGVLQAMSEIRCQNGSEQAKEEDEIFQNVMLIYDEIEQARVELSKASYTFMTLFSNAGAEYVNTSAEKMIRIQSCFLGLAGCGITDDVRNFISGHGRDQNGFSARLNLCDANMSAVPELSMMGNGLYVLQHSVLIAALLAIGEQELLRIVLPHTDPETRKTIIINPGEDPGLRFDLQGKSAAQHEQRDLVLQWRNVESSGLAARWGVGEDYVIKKLDDKEVKNLQDLYSLWCSSQSTEVSPPIFENLPHLWKRPQPPPGANGTCLITLDKELEVEERHVDAVVCVYVIRSEQVDVSVGDEVIEAFSEDGAWIPLSPFDQFKGRLNEGDVKQIRVAQALVKRTLVVEKVSALYKKVQEVTMRFRGLSLDLGQTGDNGAIASAFNKFPLIFAKFLGVVVVLYSIDDILHSLPAGFAQREPCANDLPAYRSAILKHMKTEFTGNVMTYPGTAQQKDVHPSRVLCAAEVHVNDAICLTVAAFWDRVKFHIGKSPGALTTFFQSIQCLSSQLSSSSGNAGSKTGGIIEDDGKKEKTEIALAKKTILLTPCVRRNDENTNKAKSLFSFGNEQQSDDEEGSGDGDRYISISYAKYRTKNNKGLLPKRLVGDGCSDQMLQFVYMMKKEGLIADVVAHLVRQTRSKNGTHTNTWAIWVKVVDLTNLSPIKLAAFTGSLIMHAHLPFPTYQEARKQPEVTCPLTASQQTIEKYKKFSYPGICCYPNHPQVFYAGTWHCAKSKMDCAGLAVSIGKSGWTPPSTIALTVTEESQVTCASSSSNDDMIHDDANRLLDDGSPEAQDSLNVLAVSASTSSTTSSTMNDDSDENDTKNLSLLAGKKRKTNTIALTVTEESQVTCASSSSNDDMIHDDANRLLDDGSPEAQDSLNVLAVSASTSSITSSTMNDDSDEDDTKNLRLPAGKKRKANTNN